MSGSTAATNWYVGSPSGGWASPACPLLEDRADPAVQLHSARPVSDA
ncbi:MAG: hypothetical protein ACXVHQ_38280 [Solirubrobacteraceae bacterium]